MALFFLEYDLRKRRNYQKLYDELARFKAVHVLDSAWCFNRVKTNAARLRDHLMKFIDADDGLAVTDVVDWATYGVDETPE